VDTMRCRDPPGRFLKKSRGGGGTTAGGGNGVWVEIGDRKAREKTSQALRERAPELRSELDFGRKGEDKGGLVMNNSSQMEGGNQGRTVVGNPTTTLLSNALVGPNVVMRREGEGIMNVKPFYTNAFGNGGPNVIPQQDTIYDTNNHYGTINNTQSMDFVQRRETEPRPLMGGTSFTIPPTHRNGVIQSNAILSRSLQSSSMPTSRVSVVPTTTTPAPSSMMSCSVQANVGIRTISSAEDDLVVVECKKQPQQQQQQPPQMDVVVSQKSTRGVGPRIKMLKERIQKVA